MSANPNPFLEPPPDLTAVPPPPPPDPSINPFAEPGAAVEKITPACGNPNCERSHRPDGSHYSLDRKARYQELVEDDKFGPQFAHLAHMGKDRSAKRALEVVAESASQNADKIAKVYRDAIHEEQPISVRLKAAGDWIGVETEVEKLALKQRAQEFEELSRGELADEILSMLSGLQGAGMIAEEALSIPDAEVVEE